MPAKKRRQAAASSRTRAKSSATRKKKATTRNKTAVRKKAARRSASPRSRTTRKNVVKKTKTRKKVKKAAKAARRTKKAARRTKKVAGRSGARKIAAGTPRTARTGGSTARLTKKDLEQFRTMLLLKRAQLAGDVNTLREITRQRGEAGNLSHMPLHMADIGSDNFEQEFTFGLIQSERALLGEINEALQRIENGTYGICAATGKPISKARLKAKPWAKYCYEYELELERGRHRHP